MGKTEKIGVFDLRANDEGLTLEASALKTLYGGQNIHYQLS